MSDPTGFQTSFLDSLKEFIDNLFTIVAPPLASPTDAATLVGGFNEESKQNIVNGDSQPAGSNAGQFASQPTRYLNSNRTYGIPTIDIDTPDSMVPAELGPSRDLYSFFNSSQNIGYQLPSVYGVNRFNSQNDSGDK